jgi:Glycosyl transferases group 1
MRILVSCLQSLKRHPLPAYGFWRTYFVKGLEEAGHEVIEVPGVDWAEGLLFPQGHDFEAWRARTWEATLTYVREQTVRRAIDLFVGYLFPVQVEASAIRELRRAGIPCVNFFCDNVREFRSIPPEYRPFDLHWVPEFEALPMYRAAGLPHLHAPMPCWVPIELRCTPIAETEPATFVGSADILRCDLLGRAIGGGAEIIVRGSDWGNQPEHLKCQRQRRPSIMKSIAVCSEQVRAQGFAVMLRKLEARLRPLNPTPVPQSSIRQAVAESEYFRVLREAMVTIGINRVPVARVSNRRPLVYSRLRDIEGPMLGACHLTEWTAGLERMYELGAEIETYRTAAELAAKIAELKKNRERRLGMRMRAQRRAIGEHSVAGSIDRIRRRLGLPSS